MSRKVQIRVDLPQEEYEAVKLVAGSSASVPGYMRNALKEHIERWRRSLADTGSSVEPTTRQR
jgi:hypothetical protein